jgi:hypothetical protein
MTEACQESDSPLLDPQQRHQVIILTNLPCRCQGWGAGLGQRLLYGWFGATDQPRQGENAPIKPLLLTRLAEDVSEGVRVSPAL